MSSSAWVLSRTVGLVDPLAGVEAVGTQDLLAAVLGTIATLAALFAIVGNRRRLDLPAAIAAVGLVVVLAVPAMAAEHTHGTDHVHDDATVVAAGAHYAHRHRRRTHDHSATGSASDDPIVTLTDTRLTKAQRQRALTLLNGTRAALAAFPSEDTLVAAGYRSIGDGRRVGTFEHFVNSAYMNDGNELDPLHIESIVTQLQADGTKKIASAMYILEPGATLATAPEIAGGLTPWHNHDNLCWEGGKVVGLYVAGKCVPRGEYRGDHRTDDPRVGRGHTVRAVHRHRRPRRIELRPQPQRLIVRARPRSAPEKPIRNATSRDPAPFLRCSCTAVVVRPTREQDTLVSDETPSEETPEVAAPTAAATPDRLIVTCRPPRRRHPPRLPPPVAEAPTAEVTTPDGPPGRRGRPGAGSPEPVAPGPEPRAASAAAAAPSTRKGVFVPAWAGAIVLVLVVAAARLRHRALDRRRLVHQLRRDRQQRRHRAAVPERQRRTGTATQRQRQHPAARRPRRRRRPAPRSSVSAPQATNGGVEIAQHRRQQPRRRRPACRRVT